MKKFLLPLVLVLVAQVSFAQVGGFFKPIPLPGAKSNLSLSAVAPASQWNVRPVASVSAVYGNGTQLTGGFGISIQNNTFDAASQAYLTNYSFAIVGFLGTNGSKLSGIGGLAIGIPGTNGTLSAGPAYDFTNHSWGAISGVQFKL